MRQVSVYLAALFSLTLSQLAFADDPAAAPKNVPATRTELKRALDNLKRRQPRLPLPEPTDEQKAQAAANNRPIANNGLMRAAYIPAELTWDGVWREPDPNMTLERPFRTMFFWIVARSNNCHYCLGHQEVGLARAGLSDDDIAALDGHWSELDPAKQAAFKFVKKITYEPFNMTTADIEELRKHYSDKQSLEILFMSGFYNEMSRWTDAMGIPQEDERVFMTPASDKFKDAVSLVAALDPARPKNEGAPAAPPKRPALESREEVEARLSELQSREPRFPLVEEVEARKVVGDAAPAGPLPNWIRLLANFPVQGVGRTKITLAADTAGALDPKLRAQIAWIAARNDRAWYAVHRAKLRLRELGQSDDQIYALDGSWDGFTPAEQAVFSLARKLTATPQWIVDNDIAALRKHFDDKQVGEIVHRVTMAAFFDRLTEGAGLPIEAN